MTERSRRYAGYFNGSLLMGPNSVCLLDELMTRHPLKLRESDAVLDLGCGKGLTSLFLARETGAAVYADDLWIKAEENRGRFEAWQAADRVTPIRADAACLPFERETFGAIVSIDAYHYFAGAEGFFEEKIFPFVRPGGIVLIAVPGIKAAYEGRQDELLGEWLGGEAHMLRSGQAWRRLIGECGGMALTDVWEMSCFSEAWTSWLAVDNPYARGDKEKFDSVISPFTCFVGMAIEKKA